jgi:thiamine pyrophosphate-dependent acetolactate synthase large subunit-like protein
LLIVASNMALQQEDTEVGIQLSFQQPTRPQAAHKDSFTATRYDKVGEALGAHGECVTRPGGLRPALDRAWHVAVKESRPSVINCQGRKEFWLRDQFPPGMLGKIEPGCMSYYH